MSLILEALRRSEAERRRAAPPTLFGDASPVRPRPSSAWPMALGGMAAGLLCAGAAAWWWGLGRSAAVPEAAPTFVAPAPAPEAVIDPVPPAAYGPAPRPAPVAATPRPPPEVRRAEPSPAPSPPATTAPSAPATPAAIPPATAEDGFGPREGDLPRSAVGDEAVPPLRVSMHVYAEAPERRFAIVDGQRRREGEALQPGLVLLEIRRDGLRIGWQDRVLWVPR